MIPSVAPYRVSFRYYKHKLYELHWPVLHRVISTKPIVSLLVDNISNFIVSVYYHGQWLNTFPLNISHKRLLPVGLKLDITLNTGDHIERIWNLI